MINLENKCVLVRTVEEYEKIMEEAEKQGFKCREFKDVAPLLCSSCIYILKFCSNKSVLQQTYQIDGNILQDASKLLGTKEMTEREFIGYVEKISDCRERKCENCVLNFRHTKCKETLCDIRNWKNNTEELISIVKSGKTTIKEQKEEVIETLEQFISNSTNEESIKKDIKYAIDYLKKEGK